METALYQRAIIFNIPIIVYADKSLTSRPNVALITTSISEIDEMISQNAKLLPHHAANGSMNDS